MDQTRDRNKGMPKNYLTGTERITAPFTPLRSLPGGRPADRAQVEQRAKVNSWTALLHNEAAIFAHEVASPLGGISASLQLIEGGLKRNPVEDFVLTTTIHGVRQEVDRLGGLLNEFRTLSVPKSLDLRSSDLREVIEEVLAVQIPAYTAAGVTVKFDFEATYPALMLDQAKIKQVILNLCNNAIDAMPKGGHLTIRGYTSGEAVILEISDNGIGIPEGMNIFALFKTTKLNGSGLGLPIVAQIVSAHNGTIDYTSEPDRGTTFRIVFMASV